MATELLRMEGIIVQLKNDEIGFSALYNTVVKYYEVHGERSVFIFESQEPSDDFDSGYYVRFLMDRKNVIEYKICSDRNMSIAILSLAIGPHYFNPGEFWNYKNSQRFTLEATTEGLEFNLKLLDEFLGYM